MEHGKYRLQAVLDEVRNKSDEMLLKAKVVSYCKDELANILMSIPEYIYDKAVYVDSVTVWNKEVAIGINYPYIQQDINTLKYILTHKLGFVFDHEWEHISKSMITLRYKKEIDYGTEEEPFVVRITFTGMFNAQDENSSCVLVPLEKKKKVVTEVVVYDRICPEGHPELFKQNEEGKLVYVGDNLFPAEIGE
jgi:hypothetical protein